MAVTYKDGQFGSKENTMTVADPIVLSSALPRFLSPGIRSQCPSQSQIRLRIQLLPKPR